MPATTEKSEKRTPTVSPTRRPRLRPAYLVLLVVLGLFAWKFLERVQEVRTLTAQRAALQTENRQLQDSNARIRANIRYEQTDSYVESAARQLLGLTKAGETPIQVQPGAVPSMSAVPTHAAAPPPPPPPTWRQWWNAFFG